jgi:hypothetical protein
MEAASDWVSVMPGLGERRADIFNIVWDRIGNWRA